jgi:hypothetical protein
MSTRAASWDPERAPTSWAPAAIVAGALWAGFGVRSGFAPEAYFALFAGGSRSLWLLLVSLSQLASDRRLLETALPTAAVSLLVLTWLGRWLLDSTHHRPLGAVTFAFAALLVFALAWLVFARRRVPLAVGVLALVAASAWVSVLLLPFGPKLLEPVLGIGLAVLLFLLGSRVRARSAALSLGCAGALLSAALISVVLAPGVVNHPFILGLPGLLH